MARALSLADTAARRLEVEEAGLEEIEIQLLLEGIRLLYGYDFHEYAHGPLRRGVATAMRLEGATTVSAYQDRVLHDTAAMQRLLGTVGVSVTGMFRQPEMIRCLRDEVIPVLRTYPSVRVWVAGCSTGEEVYSMAIVLEEEGIRRARIYATDLNEDALDVARTGSYPLERVSSYEDQYAHSGGTASLAAYYAVSGGMARFHRRLKSSVTWARHNLVTDASFNEFHLIVCANVLIYFRPALQQKAHRLFCESLMRSGYLALGQGESLVFAPESSRYQEVRPGMSLFRKVR